MARYHIVFQSLKSSKIYYLAKTIRLNDKVVKIREKIGNTLPSSSETAELTSKPNLRLEKKAIEKKVGYALEHSKVKYIGLDAVRKLEESKYWGYIASLFLTSSEREYYETSSEVEYVHGTTAIEGNTFSLQQVDDLYLSGIPPSDKSLREINEVQNYKGVQSYRESYKGRVTLQFIKRLHEIIMDKIDSESAGLFRRRDDIGIRGVDISVWPSILIEEELQRIIDEYYENVRDGCHPFEEAVLFHYRFEVIHPFTDGNGRVGREVLNHMLTRARYPRLIVSKQDRGKYLGALRSGNKDDYHSMMTGFLDILENNRAKVFKDIMEGKFLS